MSLTRRLEDFLAGGAAPEMKLTVAKAFQVGDFGIGLRRHTVIWTLRSLDSYFHRIGCLTVSRQYDINLAAPSQRAGQAQVALI